MYNLLEKHNFKNFERHPLSISRVPLIPKLDRIDGDEYRLYQTPEGARYPSVTSVFSIIDKPEIDAWRERMGPEEADKWTRRAGVKGTILHEMCERYVLNQLREYQNEYNYISVTNFLPIKKFLDEKIDNIVASELQIYSDKLKSAGTIDLIAEVLGKLCIIDFKTSNQHKYRNDILHYFMQGAAYAYMANEWLETDIKDIIILMLVDGGHLLIFHEKVEDHFKNFLKLRINFKETYNI